MTRYPNRKPTTTSGWKCPPGKKLPPYGAILATAYMQGLMPKNRECVVFLDHWPERPSENPTRPVVACPPDASPESFDWRPLAGLDIFVLMPESGDGDRLRRLLRELSAVKPRRLIVLRPEAPHAEFIVSVKHGQEVAL
jgi:hypothetical protein